MDLGRVSPSVVARAVMPRHGVWLDGGDAGRQLLPVSVAGELSARSGVVRLRTRDAEVTLPVDAFDAIALLLEQLGAPGSDGPRLFGFLGYDLGGALEQMPEPPAADMPVPDMWLAVVDTWLERDAREDADWVLRRGSELPAARPLESVAAEVAEAVGRRYPALPPVAPADRIDSCPDEDGYRAAVSRTVARVHAGELFETNICRRLSAAWPDDPETFYLGLRQQGPAEYGAFVRGDSWAVASLSPELYLRVRDGAVETRPIKGTRPRAEPGADRAAVEELLGSEKEAAELAMIVDLARNDLGRVCSPGTVEVAAHRAVMSLPTVHHTYSVIRGRLDASAAPGALLRATFPPASITGAPKIHAMRVAYAEEPARRGPAMGAIGWLAPSGDLELSVAIRTAAIGAGRVVYHAGCGIVADSDPDRELLETTAKARPFLQALGRV
jgi:anthranilate/para-aminobenzoate synthase component I